MEYSALVRLLSLNNQVHDLENRLLASPLPRDHRSPGPAWPDPSSSPIAGMQEEIAQGWECPPATNGSRPPHFLAP
jgi:hypothetical protein